MSHTTHTHIQTNNKRHKRWAEDSVMSRKFNTQTKEFMRYYCYTILYSEKITRNTIQKWFIYMVFVSVKWETTNIKGEIRYACFAVDVSFDSNLSLDVGSNGYTNLKLHFLFYLFFFWFCCCFFKCFAYFVYQCAPFMSSTEVPFSFYSIWNLNSKQVEITT